ncbi:MAG: hypothetical protein QF592_01250 [Alphaproteobacteria bacterium]|jgi:hypothetical protein|nr:hypothetical protein [Alphaproteobacteria bacterium]|tara:strand:+ start:177 stop:614 length:438 start_codon:yes stop_codon:yes gene_type:complete
MMRWLSPVQAFPALILAAAVLFQGFAAGGPAAQAAEQGTVGNTAEPASDVFSFVAGFEALPLMPGMHNVAGSSVVFDTPTGRIIESAIAGITTPDKIKTFYARSLPQLGWERFVETEYRREDEILKLEISSDGDYVVVHFFLSPK